MNTNTENADQCNFFKIVDRIDDVNFNPDMLAFKDLNTNSYFTPIDTELKEFNYRMCNVLRSNGT